MRKTAPGGCCSCNRRVYFITLTAIDLLYWIWLGRALVMVSYQAYIASRFNLQIQDRFLSWTESNVYPSHQAGMTYLLESFLNEQVAWDSE